MTKLRHYATRVYACYLYAYIRHTCIYALERFILNMFCVNRRIYSVRLFYNVPIWTILKCLRDYIVADRRHNRWAGTTLQRNAVIGYQFFAI